MFVRSLRVQHAEALQAYFGKPARRVHWLAVLDFHGRRLWSQYEATACGAKAYPCPLIGGRRG